MGGFSIILGVMFYIAPQQLGILRFEISYSLEFIGVLVIYYIVSHTILPQLLLGFLGSIDRSDVVGLVLIRTTELYIYINIIGIIISLYTAISSSDMLFNFSISYAFVSLIGTMFKLTVRDYLSKVARTKRDIYDARDPGKLYIQK